MYKVLSGSALLMDPSENLLLIDPVLELAQNEAGSFSFSLALDHPAYSVLKHADEITVFKDGEGIFYGRIVSIESDFYGTKTCQAEGELAFLADSIQRPAEYHDLSVRGFIQALLDNHNEQSDYKFELGMVNITDPNDSLYRYTNYEDTLFCLMDKVINRLGGIINIRHEDGTRILDVYSDYPRMNSQVIRFKENLMDYVSNSDILDLATVVIPRGATVGTRSIEALEERVSIKSVNGQKDYLESSAGITKYGRICKVVTFDDINTPSLLKTRGQQWLDHNQYESLQIEVSAVDLSLLDTEMMDFRLLDKIRVLSDFHQIDEYYPLTSVKLCLLQPDQNIYHLGGTVQSYTSAQKSAQVSITKKMESIKLPNDLVQEAKDQVNQLLNNFGKYGHVVQVQNEEGQIQEICIIDTQDLETAQKVWRWNVGGLGFSSNGYTGPYQTAMTMDGTISGQMIAANSIAAEKIDVSYRSRVEKQITDSLEAAKEDTAERLRSYWTQVETETAIKNSAGEITLSVTQSAKDYVDNQFTTKLAQYYTKSEVDVLRDSITLRVYQESALPSNLLPYTADWGSTYSWSRHSACTISEQYTGGGKLLEYTDSNTGEVQILEGKSLGVTLQADCFYTFSGYMKASSSALITLQLRAGKRLQGTTTNHYSSYCTVSSDADNGLITLNLRPPSYHSRFAVTFRVTSESTPETFGMTITRSGLTSSSNTISFSRFKLEKGRTATDYQRTMGETTSSLASLQVNYDSIVSKVATKVGTTEIASYIQQNAEAVRIAWSNISNYIEFSGGSINIFSTSNKTAAYRLMQLDQSGLSFWRDSYNLGRIGVNSYANQPSARGLVFDLEYQGSYMAWASMDSSTSDSYIIRMMYCNRPFGSYLRNHLYFSSAVDFQDDVDFHNHMLNNAQLKQPSIVNSSGYAGMGSWSSPTSVKIPSSINSDGTVQEWYNCTVAGGVIY